MNPGRLLAFEGVDGCGKSTQIERLAPVLREVGHDVLVTREPTGGPWGRRIREMARRGETVAPEQELRCFVEDRREHAARTLAPALRAGRIVLTDRYYLSSVAYQGARGLDWRGILEESEAEFPVPDLVLLLEIEPEAGLERVRARAGGVDSVFERRDFLERVVELFRCVERPYVERIPAQGELEEVHAAVRERVARRLGLLPV